MRNQGEFKYRITALLGEVPGLIGEKETALGLAIGVSQSTIQKLRRLKSTDIRAMSTDQLEAMRQHFSEVNKREVTLNEIMNVSRPVAAAA